MKALPAPPYIYDTNADFCYKVQQCLPNRDDVRSSNDSQVHQSEMVAKYRTLAVIQHPDMSWNFTVLLNFIHNIDNDASDV